MLKNPLKVIHLACYQSNIGDNANIRGLRNIFGRTFSDGVRWTDWELLDYSWGLDNYSQEQIDFVNTHDVLIVGGGGFFEIIGEQSADNWTGTRFNLPEALFDKIRIPIVFHGVGVDVARHASPGNVERFGRFLQRLTADDRMLVSTRNDGSSDILRRLFPGDLADAVPVIPDGGFFTQVGRHEYPMIGAGRRIIAVNLAGDMLPIRFPPDRPPTRYMAGQASTPIQPPDYELNGSVANHTLGAFIQGLADTLNRTLARHEDLDIVFVPHIYKDIDFSAQVIARMGFPACRRRAYLAPYLNGETGQSYLFGLYAQAACVLGMRFHANVCPIGLAVPTIGLLSYPQIAGLYNALERPERSIDVNADDFPQRLEALIEVDLAAPETARADFCGLRARLEADLRAFHGRVATLLGR